MWSDLVHFSPLIILYPEGLLHSVGRSIAQGEKPGATTQLMIPPLFLHACLVLAHVEVFRPLVRRGRLRRPLVELSAKAELVDTPFSTSGAAQEKRHGHDLYQVLYQVDFTDL